MCCKIEYCVTGIFDRLWYNFINLALITLYYILYRPCIRLYNVMRAKFIILYHSLTNMSFTQYFILL